MTRIDPSRRKCPEGGYFQNPTPHPWEEEEEEEEEEFIGSRAKVSHLQNF